MSREKKKVVGGPVQRQCRVLSATCKLQGNRRLLSKLQSAKSALRERVLNTRSPERESGERGTPKPTAILSRAPQGASLFPLRTVEGVGPAQQVGLENLSLTSGEKLACPWARSSLETRKSPPEPLLGQDWCKVYKCSSGGRVEGSVGEPWNGSRSPACFPAFATCTHVPRSSPRTKYVHSSWEEGSIDTCSSRASVYLVICHLAQRLTG